MEPFSFYQEKIWWTNWYLYQLMKEPNAKKNACWVFETVQIILRIISLICFTEKVYGSSPYSPSKFIY